MVVWLTHISPVHPPMKTMNYIHVSSICFQQQYSTLCGYDVLDKGGKVLSGRKDLAIKHEINGICIYKTDLLESLLLRRNIT